MDPPTPAPEELVLRLTELLSTEEDLLAAWLFGSRATGRARPDSDVDLAVLGPETLSFDRRMAFEARVDAALHLEPQVVDLRTASADLCHRVFRDGVLVKDCAPATRITFMVNRRNEYFDLQPILRRYRRAEGLSPLDP